VTVLAALLAFVVLTSASDPCAELQPGRTITARLVTSRTTPGNTLIATVCVVPGRGAAGQALKIGSYHGELHFDSTTATVARVDKAEGGVRVENATIKGQVNFAGAAPAGFPGRALVTVVLKVATPATKPTLRLTIKELNTTDGQKLSQDVVVEGAP
jgi:hypothetical protein